MIVRYHSVSLNQDFVALGDRDAVQQCFRQVFTELGLSVHKDSISTLVHWIGGKAAPILCLLTAHPKYGYWIVFESVGYPDATGVQIFINIGYGSRWGPESPEDKARKPIKAFMRKLQEVSAERRLAFLSKDQWKQDRADN